MKKPLKLPSNELKVQVQKKLSEIVDYLVNIENKDENPSALLSGNMGIGLFLFYYARFTQSEYYAEKAMEFLESAINNIDKNLNHAFCNGISGVCWGVDHLIANGFIDIDNSDILNSFDDYLCSRHSLIYISIEITIFCMGQLVQHCIY